MDDTLRPPAAPDQRDSVAEWLALKDRALDVAAEGVTIADARQPIAHFIYAERGFRADDRLRRGGGDGPQLPVPAGTRTPTRPSGRDPLRPRGEPRVRRRNPELPEGRHDVLEPVVNHPRPQRCWRRHAFHRRPVRRHRAPAGRGADRRSKEALEQDLRLAARVQQALLPPAESRPARSASRTPFTRATISLATPWASFPSRRTGWPSISST